MPRTTKTITTTWSLVASKSALITLKDTVRGGIHFNDTANESTKYSMRAEAGYEYLHPAESDIYARVDYGTVAVIVEEDA